MVTRMKKLPALVGLLFAIVGAGPAHAESTSGPLTVIGVGSHGFDFIIGRWICTNSMTTQLGQSRAPFGLPYAPPTVSYAYRAEADGSLSWILSVPAISDASTGRLHYAAETKAWSMSYTAPSGWYGEQSTHDTGQKVVWTGSEWDANKRPMTARDTWTFSSPTKYLDLGEYLVSGRWFVAADSTCTRS